jgi:hypothetical protein
MQTAARTRAMRTHSWFARGHRVNTLLVSKHYSKRVTTPLPQLTVDAYDARTRHLPAAWSSSGVYWVYCFGCPHLCDVLCRIQRYRSTRDVFARALGGPTPSNFQCQRSVLTTPNHIRRPKEHIQPRYGDCDFQFQKKTKKTDKKTRKKCKKADASATPRPIFRTASRTPCTALPLRPP